MSQNLTRVERGEGESAIYCRVWVPTGTRIAQTECISEKELADRKYKWDHRNLNAR